MRVEEKRAEAGEKPMPEAAEAQAELKSLFAEMNRFAVALDPLTAHLEQPICTGMLAGLETALGQQVELERVSWERTSAAPKGAKGKKKKSAPEMLVLTVQAIAADEETATSLAEVLGAYTGMPAEIEDHEPVPERWPAVRLRVRLEAQPGAVLTPQQSTDESSTDEQEEAK